MSKVTAEEKAKNNLEDISKLDPVHKHVFWSCLNKRTSKVSWEIGRRYKEVEDQFEPCLNDIKHRAYKLYYGAT